MHPELRAQLAATGGRVNAWFMNWLRIAGSADPERDAPIVMNHWTGLVLHQLASPGPGVRPDCAAHRRSSRPSSAHPAEVPA